MMYDASNADKGTPTPRRRIFQKGRAPLVGQGQDLDQMQTVDHRDMGNIFSRIQTPLPFYYNKGALNLSFAL